jgi:hypothetical protein
LPDVTDSEADKRERAEPPEGQQNREREGPGSEHPATHPEPVPDEAPEEKDEDARVDRDAAETFPASDPPANY